MPSRARHVVYTHRYDSPVGALYLAVNRDGAVMRVGFTPPDGWPEELTAEENKYACGELEHQLELYFRGRLQCFTVAVVLGGTSFQHSVWKRLAKIEYGSTITYGELARKIGRTGAARAVGNAVARNPIPIVIPCHRVVRAGSSIGQYALRSVPGEHGARIKRTLLELEGAL